MKAVFRSNIDPKALSEGEWTFNPGGPEHGAAPDGLHFFACLPNGHLAWLDPNIFKWKWDGRTLDVSPTIHFRAGSGHPNGEWIGTVREGVWIETGTAAIGR